MSYSPSPSLQVLCDRQSESSHRYCGWAVYCVDAPVLDHPAEAFIRARKDACLLTYRYTCRLTHIDITQRTANCIMSSPNSDVEIPNLQK